MHPSGPKTPQHPLNSLATQFVLFVFLAILVTAALLSWISLRSAQQQRLSEVEHSQPLLLGAAADAMGAWLEMRLIELNGAAWSPEAAEADADALLQRLESFDALVVLDSGGLPLRSSRDSGALKDALAAFGRVMTTHLSTVVTEDGEHAILALAPLPNPTGHTGGESGAAYLAASIHSVHLHRVLEREVLAWAGSVAPRLRLVTREGVPIRGAHSGPTAPASEASKPAATATTLPAVEVVRGHITASGRPALVSSQPLPGFPLAIVQETFYDDLFAPIRSLALEIIVFDLVILALFSIAAQRVVKRIMRPIALLSEGAQRITEGQMDHEIPDPHSDNEMGLLTRTFNTMMARLRANQQQIEETNEELRQRNHELQSANEVLAQLSITDGLTRLHNHRYFQDQLSREIRLHTRNGAPLSMLLIDLDNFKQLNDRYGHAVGDETLVRVATILNDSVRSSDLCARYGGEEFVILMPSTNLEGALRLAEKVRIAIERGDFSDLAENESLDGVSVSVGVAQFDDDRREFFAAADRALYEAKAMGKNCVKAAGVSSL